MLKSTAKKLIKEGWSDDFIKECLEKIRNRRKGRYKVIITGDRKDYDNLSELVDHPEKGVFMDCLYLDNPDELEPIVAVYEGLFYQLFDTKESETERMGGGVVDNSIWEDWWDKDCCGVCQFCFLRKESRTGWECINPEKEK